MTAVLDFLSIATITAGAVFFVAGTLGLLRFPDVYARLHALTKCDNLGLGFVVLGLTLRAPSWWMGLKMIGVWILVLAASATAAHLFARRTRLSEDSKSIRRNRAP